MCQVNIIDTYISMTEMLKARYNLGYGNKIKLPSDFFKLRGGKGLNKHDVNEIKKELFKNIKIKIEL